MISVIIPTYNEENYIGKVLENIPKIVNEVIVVDDGSKDNTIKIIEKYPVTLIKHKKNMGKGTALKTGIKNASSNILVFMDGDMQHNPKDITRVVEPLLHRNVDFVNTSRFLGNWKNMPLLRMVFNFLIKKIILLVSGRKITDPLSGFKAIKKNAILNIELKSQGYEFETNLIFEVLKNKLKFIEIPIDTIYNTKTSKATFFDSLKILEFILIESIRFKR